MKELNLHAVGALMLCGTMLAGTGCATAQEARSPGGAAVAVPPIKPVPPVAPRAITIKRLEAAEEEDKERTWLGVGLGEPDEALSSQLGLKDGVGLLVTYVAEDSPAAKAGLQKNDVLLEMEGQTLVVPAQLQKLVKARKEGDTVALKFLRGGKQDSVTATLGKTKTPPMMSDGSNAFLWHSGIPGGATGHPGAVTVWADKNAAMADHMVILKKALEDAKVDQKRVQVEVRRSVEEARRAMEEALRTAKQAGSVNVEAQKELEALARSGVFVPNDATVVVRSTGKSSKSMVSTDDSGTIVLVKNPKLRLTAHDKDGKLLFDGEVETPEQREKIPTDLLKKVEPMLEKFSPGADE